MSLQMKFPYREKSQPPKSPARSESIPWANITTASLTASRTPSPSQTLSPHRWSVKAIPLLRIIQSHQNQRRNLRVMQIVMAWILGPVLIVIVLMNLMQAKATNERLVFKITVNQREIRRTRCLLTLKKRNTYISQTDIRKY